MQTQARNNLFQKFVISQLDSVDKNIQTHRDGADILVCYSIVDSIKNQVSEIQGFSPEILSRVGDTLTLIESLIPEGQDGIDVFPIGNIEIILLSTAITIYSPEGEATIIEISEKHKSILSNIIKYGNHGLEINDTMKAALANVSEELNELFNSFGLYFGISDGKFYISDEELSGVLPEEDLIKKENIIPTLEDQIEIIHKNRLYFGVNGEESLNLEISTPVKKGSTTRIGLKIGDSSISLTQKELKLFIELISLEEGESVICKSGAHTRLHTTLGRSPIELIGTSTRGIRIALRSDSLNNIKYFNRNNGNIEYDYIISKSIPYLSEIKLKPPVERDLSLQNSEKMDGVIAGYKTIVKSVFYVGAHRKFRVKVGEEIIELTQKQRELLEKCVSGDMKMTAYERQLFLKLKAELPAKVFSFISDKSIVDKAKKSKKPISRVNKSTKNTKLEGNEVIDFFLGNNSYKILTATGNGNLIKYRLEILQDGAAQEELINIDLTTKEFELFSLLANNINQVVNVGGFGPPTLSSLRLKLPNMIKNKRGEGYYIGVLSNYGLSFGEEENLSSVNSMIDNACSGYNQKTNEVSTRDRRHPKVKEQVGVSDDIIPLSAEELRKKFDIGKFI